jgi:hypothetical protein
LGDGKRRPFAGHLHCTAHLGLHLCERRRFRIETTYGVTVCCRLDRNLRSQGAQAYDADFFDWFHDSPISTRRSVELLLRKFVAGAGGSFHGLIATL